MESKSPTITVLTSLYHCEKYLDGYFYHLSQISNMEDVEILLLHNEPSESELHVIRKYAPKFSEYVRYIVIEERESLYSTLNRGVALARGKYIAMWNVDDIRLPDSLECEARTLDKHPEAALTYGDVAVVYEYGKTEGKFCYQPEYEEMPKEFLRSYFGVCFPMWQKSIHERVGYFDEQMVSGGDFDFWVRVVRNYSLRKTKGLLGYYLNEHRGLSTSGWRQPVERTVIELRYGQFDKIDFIYLPKAIRNYNLTRIYGDGKTFPINQFFPDYRKFIITRLPLFFIGIIKFPFRLAIYLYRAITQLFTLGPKRAIKKIVNKIKVLVTK